MDSYQLLSILHQDLYAMDTEVISRDFLPSSGEGGYIMNSDASNKPGRHWVALYFPRNEAVEFVDSLGHPPEYYNITTWNYYKYNMIKLQSDQSQSCGYFCLYYIIHRSRGRSMETIMKDFTSDLYKNEKTVRTFISNYHIPKTR